MLSPDYPLTGCNVLLDFNNNYAQSDFNHLFCTEQGLTDEHEFTWLCPGDASNPCLISEKEEYLHSLNPSKMDYSFDSQLHVHDAMKDITFRRSSTSASLVDLDEEGDEWAREGDEGLGPDFPSPSYRIRRKIKTRYSSLLGSGSSGGSSPASPFSIFQLSPAGPPGDEPLFWPLNQRSYSEFQGNYLGISPRASVMRIQRRSSFKPVQIRVRESSEDNSRRIASRITVSLRASRSPLGSRRPEKTKLSCSQVSRTTRGPSRLSRSSVASESSPAERRNRHKLSSIRKKPGVNKKPPMVQWLLEFEAGYFQVFLAGGISVEALVGLEEFDGH
ncbi:uncharacterized protein LOC144705696 isoform X2 [Wolffia australiana]